MTWLGRLATLVMLAVLAWVGSGIFWSLTTPQTSRPATAMETDPQKAVQAIAGRHLFGIAPAGNAANGTASNALTDIKLSGTIAAQQSGGQAFALLSVEGKPPQVIREGAEVLPGVTLQRVLARQVELLRGGQTQTLNLPEAGKGGPGVVPPPGMMPGQPLPSGMIPPQPIPPGQMPQPNRGGAT